MDTKAFAISVPDWVKKLDKDIFATVFAIITDHRLSGEPLTEDSLKKEIAEFDDLTDEQQKRIFDVMLAHKD